MPLSKTGKAVPPKKEEEKGSVQAMSGVFFRVVDVEWHQSAEASRLLASIDQKIKGGGVAPFVFASHTVTQTHKLSLLQSCGCARLKHCICCCCC